MSLRTLRRAERCAAVLGFGLAAEEPFDWEEPVPLRFPPERPAIIH